MGLALAIIAGLALGTVLERGDFCFHSTLRGPFRRPREFDLLRAYLVVLLVAVPLVNGMIWLGWIEPWIPPFAWQANVVGGLIFGVGMVAASSCITGFFYKLGHGMIGVLIGLAAWALGDIITYRGPLASLREALNAAPITVAGEPATVTRLFGPTLGWLILGALAVLAGVYLLRSPRVDRRPHWDWLVLGVATGLVTSLAWLLATAGGSDYTYGTARVPTSVYDWLIDGASIDYWIPVSLTSLVFGALIASIWSKTLWVRGESMKHYGGLALGGLLMGVGAAISGGCNLGHSLVGVPLLSLGSITGTLSMAVGILAAHQILKATTSGGAQPATAGSTS